MIRIFKTIDGKMHQMEEACEGCWVALTNPTATEIFAICNRFQIEVDDLRAPLDEECARGKPGELRRLFRRASV